MPLEQLDYVRALEMGNGEWLAWARSFAKSYATLHGSVSSDDVRREADRVGLQPDSPHSFGAVFKEKGWRVIAREPSRIPSNNKRWINRFTWEGV